MQLMHTHLNDTQGIVLLLLKLLQQLHGRIPQFITNVIQITFCRGDWVEGHFAGLGLLSQPYFLLLPVVLNLE